MDELINKVSQEVQFKAAIGESQEYVGPTPVSCHGLNMALITQNDDLPPPAAPDATTHN
jgi:hypothetical protein